MVISAVSKQKKVKFIILSNYVCLIFISFLRLNGSEILFVVGVLVVFYNAILSGGREPALLCKHIS